MADADPIDELDRDDPADLRERWTEAAIAAELATGRREATIVRAKANIFVRVARMSLGTVVLLAGVACLVLPGPGWLLIAAGLAILARDVAWAERLLAGVRRRIPGSTDGEVPKRVVVISVVLMLVGAAASLWWYLR
jgi:uncharacterized protein (TIGR02611 family)